MSLAIGRVRRFVASAVGIAVHRGGDNSDIEEVPSWSELCALVAQNCAPRAEHRYPHRFTGRKPAPVHPALKICPRIQHSRVVPLRNQHYAKLSRGLACGTRYSYCQTSLARPGNTFFLWLCRWRHLRNDCRWRIGLLGRIGLTLRLVGGSFLFLGELLLEPLFLCECLLQFVLIRIVRLL